MAAFNPLPLLPALLPAVAPVSGADAAAEARLQQSLDTQAAEARLADQERRQDLAAARRDLEAKLADSQAARQADLAKALASERVRQAASGISGGRSGRALLDGLTHQADSAQTAEQEAAARRLDDIRRQADAARRKDLLAMADARRRADLTRRARAEDAAQARTAAIFDRLTGGGGASGGLGSALYGAAGSLIDRW